MRTDISQSTVLIEHEHHKTHMGDSFFYSDYFTVANVATLAFVLQTGSKDLHFTYSINSDQAGFSLITHEGITFDAAGTGITPLNNNRNSSNTSTLTLTHTPTNLSTSGATQLRKGYAGTAANPAQRTGGSVNRSNEVILKKNTKYSLQITNLSSSNNDIQVVMLWYEV